MIQVGRRIGVGDHVTILHGVTLGSSGKESGDRYPKIRRGVLIGAGATILGNIEIGEYARVGAGSVVRNVVPAYRTAVGVPSVIPPSLVDGRLSA